MTSSLWEEYDIVDVADVVVDTDAPGLEPTYTYLVPDALKSELKAGDCVHISFAGREALGYIISKKTLPSHHPLCARLKPILGKVDEAVSLSSDLVDLALWICEKYVCDLRDAIHSVSPSSRGARLVTTVRLNDPGLRGMDAGSSITQAHLIEILHSLGGTADKEALREAAQLAVFSQAYSSLIKKGLLQEKISIEQSGASEKTVKLYSLGPAAEVLGGAGRRSMQQQLLLQSLLARAKAGKGATAAEELLREAGANSSSLQGLVKRGLVLVQESKINRRPHPIPDTRTTAPSLTEGQLSCLKSLHPALDAHTFQTTLLFGVTASGKTEVYLEAIGHTLSQGRSAMALLPEIALTAQVADIFLARFGDQVALLHSRLSEGERYDEWRRILNGQARIVVGARSAVFAPLDNIGLIVLDEEHETSYKQENTPRYNARDIASERARANGSLLLLGSATPSMESYHAAEMKRYQLLEMKERVGNRPLPYVHSVDMRNEFQQKPVLFSGKLIENVQEKLAKKQQIILFLNRRGYAQFVLCRDCGWTARCPRCAVSLAYHSYSRLLQCHHCDYTDPAPNQCPNCSGERVKGFGVGTERVEEEAMRLFPEARIARLDRDSSTRKGSHSRILNNFRSGGADILIGTQMVAKGLDFPNVTLVGVINADTAINMPDFRAAERTFQLLTQVAGRSGRGAETGEVIIQTFCPEHYALQTAMQHDFPAFYKQELLFRQELGYPPFRKFANLICSDPLETIAKSVSESLASSLRKFLSDSVEMIGPAPAPLTRLKNQYRYHVTLRGPNEAPLSQIVSSALAAMPASLRYSITVDIDPLSMS